ncbi:NAD(P)-dependent alcohol dehydrogenase [Alicyclobacillus sp. ALC3]|uniref:NAD(P)-dependent alcohol dehydrogenase n=1 Tax=Alicyclobacillus sp. ALC3 TaxID=2796143 RepID=UPI0023780F0A|nr:NAD(P)-dependent alcohol dehydrogenase [Alicyclobacillus sp. ALC3]WDL97627.1 NAD(P)-dependent alcohol dehydrogenase [Alicyclobacillus sp. ALC3]
MNVRAAVTHAKGATFEVETVQLDAPGAHEVLVKLVASGICHTDLSVRDQAKPVPLPAVLGHEGAGVVVEVGRGVTRVKPNDHVIMSYGSCGHCRNCRGGAPYLCSDMYELNFAGTMPDGTHRIHLGGEAVSTFFGQSSFGAYAVVPDRNLVLVNSSLPLRTLAPLGCGVQTGSGIVLNRLNCQPGESLVVFGCGTVGLSAVMAGRTRQLDVIAVIDLNPERLALARELGATHVLNAAEFETGRQVTETLVNQTRGGFDYAIDAVGSPNILESCVASVRMGGTAVLVGGTALGTKASIDMNTLLFGRTLTGVVEGDSVPEVFIPQLIDLYQRGDFPFDRLIRFYDFEQVNEAVADMEAGLTIKPVLIFPE